MLISTAWKLAFFLSVFRRVLWAFSKTTVATLVNTKVKYSEGVD